MTDLCRPPAGHHRRISDAKRYQHFGKSLIARAVCRDFLKGIRSHASAKAVEAATEEVLTLSKAVTHIVLTNLLCIRIADPQCYWNRSRDRVMVRDAQKR